MKHFLCGNQKCQAKEKGFFKATMPICPQCGIEAKDPKRGHLIVRLAIMHFDPPSGVVNIGMGYQACDHATSILATEDAHGIPIPWHVATGRPDQVTCSECKETEEYKAAANTPAAQR